MRLNRIICTSSLTDVQRVDLQPGEILLFYGGSVVHARTPVAQEEAVAVLTAGFRPL
jgi:hypothetical protein